MDELNKCTFQKGTHWIGLTMHMTYSLSENQVHIAEWSTDQNGMVNNLKKILMD